MKQQTALKPEADLRNKINHRGNVLPERSIYRAKHQYEDIAEEVAIRRLLGYRRFAKAVDVNGGYGRLCPLLVRYADSLVLAEPNQEKINFAKEFLRDYPTVEYSYTHADNLEFGTGDVDLVNLVGVMSRLPDPGHVFAEIERVLAPSGFAIIEFTNYSRAHNRLKYMLKCRKLPVSPVSIRSKQARADDLPSIVSHNPETVIKQLAHAGLKVERALSVSNLSSPMLKTILPLKLKVSLEERLQSMLGSNYMGPSIFFLASKG